MRRAIAIGLACAGCFALGLVLNIETTGAAEKAPAAPPIPSQAATDLTAAQIQTMIKQTSVDKNLDRLVKVIDIGAYNVSVNVQHRIKGVSDDRSTMHQKVTEIYYVLDGSAEFITGGTMIDPVQAPFVKSQVKPNGDGGSTGPGVNGAVLPPYVKRMVGAGDVVFIPPMTNHWFSKIDDHINYLVFRVDPEHVLPAPFTSSDLPAQ